MILPYRFATSKLDAAARFDTDRAMRQRCPGPGLSRPTIDRTGAASLRDERGSWVADLLTVYCGHRELALTEQTP